VIETNYFVFVPRARDRVIKSEFRNHVLKKASCRLLKDLEARRNCRARVRENVIENPDEHEHVTRTRFERVWQDATKHMGLFQQPA
jgi:hypothetical protein